MFKRRFERERSNLSERKKTEGVIFRRKVNERRTKNTQKHWVAINFTRKLILFYMKDFIRKSSII